MLIFCSSEFVYAAPQDAKIISQVEAYLNSFKNLAADFEQHTIDNLSYGTLKISKPGKFRWEYADGKLLIISTGDTIIYVDNELDNVHYVSSDDTIAKFLSQDTVSFANSGYEIEKLIAHEGEVLLLIKSKNSEEIGKINLAFSMKPLTLKRIEVIDVHDNIVQLNLSNITYPDKIDHELFNYYENHNRIR
jgi:outer membrane lipoprotein-sorting protein